MTGPPKKYVEVRADVQIASMNTVETTKLSLPQHVNCNLEFPIYGSRIMQGC